MKRLAAVAGIIVAAAAAIGCHDRTPPNPLRRDGLRTTADARLTGPSADSLQVRMRVVNRAHTTRNVEHFHCAMSLTVVEARPRTSSHRRWDYSAWRRAQAGPYAEVCLAYTVHGALAPGDSTITYRSTIPVVAILGDSLPTGRYRVILGGDAKLKGGLPAGEVELRIP